MKDEPVRYLGLDVHRSTVVASVRDEQGQVVMRATVATEEKAIVALVKGVGPRVHVAFEEGTQAQWLHDLLLGHAERVVVCNVRGRDALRSADDRIDADEMSKRLRDGSFKPVFHGAPEMLTLKELVRCYNNLVQDATRVMLRIKALFRARAIATCDTRRGGVPGFAAQAVAGQARGRSAGARGLAAESTGRAARAAAEGGNSAHRAT